MSRPGVLCFAFPRASWPRAIRSPAWLLRTPARPHSTQAPKPLFDKILVANRGEIACRVMRTARRLGIKTVAVYSEADRFAQHVQMADEAHCVGPAASSQSYLNVDRILDVIHSTRAQAVHPGYGFLSENAEFSDRLHREGVTFIGPPASAIRAMGSKSESKYIMQDAKVPVVPGYHGDNQDPAYLKDQAANIGYPVLIKAVKGGGGKGMRIVRQPKDFDMMLESSRRESIKSFGDDKVLVEKYLERPRHVEVQVFADKQGNAVYLYERDCSVQRRHQKILEEAPAPHLSPEVRAQLGQKAVAAALAVNYEGAGTVEFIMDYDTQQFYFMEMNTRLQVEHPVTEMVTKTDLVQWQLEVAAGNPLPLTQAQIPLVGHAFEARIYAENPANDFLPDTGPLVHVATPPTGKVTSDTVRIDTGAVQGDQVSVHYDPMIAKLIVQGRDRAEALRYLCKALQEYQVVGLHTNINFLRSVVSHPAFVSGDVETGFIAKYEQELLGAPKAPSPLAVAQAALALGALSDANVRLDASSTDASSPWHSADAWRLNGCHQESVELVQSGASGARYTARLVFVEEGKCRVQITLPDESAIDFQSIDCRIQSVTSTIPNYTDAGVGAHSQLGTTVKLVTTLADRTASAVAVFTQDKVAVFSEGERADFVLPKPAYLDSNASEAAGSVKTPMPCKIAQVMVQAGENVEKNAPLVILEAMKMEHVIRAPFAGVVKEVYYQVGDMVPENKSLLAMEGNEAAE
ncbi:hypothetical protein H4R34_000161 [Dimargaris verticillata]|uniref:Uncharacterized protein n=1 Tax=Dimargaris verticillata TaxID=2761393 RepID=A0A9W8B5T9_9FUNG|nr:hypothetical protein H4R34_000161 [Dimargaris verticillata]